MLRRLIAIVAFVSVACVSCTDATGGAASNDEMIAEIARAAAKARAVENPFDPETRLKFHDSVLKISTSYGQTLFSSFQKSLSLLQLGNELPAITILEKLLGDIPPTNKRDRDLVRKSLAIAYLRLGERNNCIHNHGAESCLFPIRGSGIHEDLTGSLKAIEIYESILRDESADLESKWLLNIAYMTIGGYPQKVPKSYLIPNLDAVTSGEIKPFQDIAIDAGLNIRNMAGGSIVDDFNNDGHLDIITSSWDLQEGMHYCQNNGNGTFTDLSESSGLNRFTGGLNLLQTDYNNDGLKDIFVLRGAWKREYGKEPNSLLRNIGDGTFTDVTRESGLLSFHPTQTATWNDFNNDGWLDVFIGNESTSLDDINACELYINNRNGTFTNMSVESNANVQNFVKGVTSGDYDNDGWQDIFLSTLSSQKVLLRNEGMKNGVIRFRDVTEEAGLNKCDAQTFTTWFWDYDNDGWLDLLICSYEFEKSLAWYAAAENMNYPVGNAARQFLFRNRHDGTFEDVTEQVGLNRIAFAMGGNFGDIDNDGYPDIYLGTGNPMYQSLIPNKLFHNKSGKFFSDETTAARVGNLQKGHGVSFADLDNDGDLDIYMDMGGAYIGDAYQNSLYLNPGQNNNNWINISLEGVSSNRAAIGARIKLTFRENGTLRNVYRDVNSGGSFGASPLLQHIGIGQATVIERIEVKWPGNKVPQVFENLQPGGTVRIKEGIATPEKVKVAALDFLEAKRKGIIGCAPAQTQPAHH